MLTTAQIETLEALPGRVIVAFSGGCDSHVLLQYLSCHLQRDIQAIHVNHNLMADAARWQGHCETICDGLNVMLYSVSVQVKSEGSLETNAREARYSVFEKILEPSDVLLLAHHQDDQVETIMMNLLSGRAPMGVLGMPESRPLGAGFIFRPLLQQTRANIEVYAREQNLSWIDDPSNSDTQHTRNYLRHDVIPKLKGHWPELNTALQAAWQKTSVFMGRLERQAALDFESCSTYVGVLAFDRLQNLDDSRQEACLRCLLEQIGYAKLPGQRLLAEIRRVLIESPKDSGFDLGDCYLQRFRGQIFVVKKSEPESRELRAETFVEFSGGELSTDVAQGRGLSVPANQLQCRTRRAGDRIEIRGQRRSLKSLFQEFGYPPYIRDLTPLLVLDGVCIAIAAIPSWGLAGVVSDAYKASEDGYGCEVLWQPPGISSSL